MNNTEVLHAKQPERVQQGVHALNAYLQDAPVSSVKYVAFREFCTLVDYQRTYNLHLKVVNNRTSQRGLFRRNRISEELLSDLRTAEIAFKTMSVAMEREKMRNPAYEQEQTKITALFNNVVQGYIGKPFDYSPHSFEIPKSDYDGFLNAYWHFRQVDNALKRKTQPSP